MENHFEELLEQSFNVQNVNPGAIVTGVLLRKDPHEFLVDIGYKSEGVVTQRNMDRVAPDYLEQLQVGDELPVYVLQSEDDDGYVVLSLNKAVLEQDWEKAKEAFEAGETFDSEVVTSNKGGVIAYYRSVRGFIPGSQLISSSSNRDAATPWSDVIGKTLSLKIIEVDRRRNRLIISERAAVEQLKQERKEVLLAELKEGETRSGRVVGLADFGAFVDLGGAEGLVHLSELAWVQVHHPSEVVSLGDEVEVYVLDIDTEKQRIGLSIKRLQPEPWSQAAEIYEVGQLVDGTVTKLTDFGAFARIDNQLDGLIHISELSDKNVNHPREIVQEGDELQLRIISINPERRRLGLSLKQVTDPEESWSDVEEETASVVESSESVELEVEPEAQV